MYNADLPTRAELPSAIKLMQSTILAAIVALTLLITVVMPSEYGIAAGISNPKDFRNEIVNFVLRARAHNNGRNPNWTSYEKLRTVIEKKMFSNTEELLPVISFNTKTSTDEQKKHDDFVDRMMEKGYTRKQVRLLCEWYLRVRKSS